MKRFETNHPLQYGRGQCNECGEKVTHLLYVVNRHRWFVQLQPIALDKENSPQPIDPHQALFEHRHPKYRNTTLTHV